MSEVRNVKITLTVPETLVEQYELLANGGTVNAAMVKQLRHAATIDFDQRPIVVHGDGRRDIEAIAETTVENEQQLITLLKNLLRIDMGEVEILLTERQAEKLRELSTFYDEDLNEFATNKLSEALDVALGEW